MSKQEILETYSKAATETRPDLCCAVDYREELPAELLSHIPAEVLDRNYGCGVPSELRTLQAGKTVLDLGPGFGRDCFIAARCVGAEGRVVGLDMNRTMLDRAEHFKAQVVEKLGYDNIRFMEGQFDIQIPLEDNSVDVILSNCVNNLATDKPTAYAEMFRVLKAGSKLSFSDIVAYGPLPDRLRQHKKAWADCVAGVLSYGQLTDIINRAGFHGLILTTEYLWKTGEEILSDYFEADRPQQAGGALGPEERRELAAVRLYSVTVEAFKPVVDPEGECFWRGQYAIFNGPGVSLQLDADPSHIFPAGTLKEVCEKTASLLKSSPFNRHFTVFEAQGEVQPRACLPEDKCC